MSLHDELQQLADTAPRPQIDHSVWDRGRALRRRDRLVTSAVVVVLVLVIGGMGTLLAGPPRAVAPADDTVPDGAIPSRIYEPPGSEAPRLERDFDIGRASVAFVGLSESSPTPYAVVIGATDGRYHFFSLPALDQDREAVALSPDGTRLAWRTDDGVLHVADLTTGEVTDLRPQFGQDRRSSDLEWRADSTHLVWSGQQQGGVFDVVTGEEESVSARDPFTHGSVSPEGNLAVVENARPGSLPQFRTNSGTVLTRPVPADLYPAGAASSPLGWTRDRQVVAWVLGREESRVEGAHLVLFTPPDRPKSEWTYRILVRDLPDFADFPDPFPLSVAVDLIPELDGTSSQQLTHDFGEPEWPGQGPDRLPLILGALIALLGGLAFIRMLRYQR